MSDLTGQKIGRRIVLGLAQPGSQGRIHWRVQCECGRIDECRTDSIYRPCRTCCRPKSQPKRRLRPYESGYNAWTHRAKKKHSVLLTYEQFLELTKIINCHYCGCEIRWTEYLNKTIQGRRHGSNLDRKDNDLGYDIDNVVVCCGRCNAAKNAHFTYEEWLQLSQVIRSWSKISG
jgi:hypothetical protein